MEWRLQLFFTILSTPTTTEFDSIYINFWWHLHYHLKCNKIYIYIYPFWSTIYNEILGQNYNLQHQTELVVNTINLFLFFQKCLFRFVILIFIWRLFLWPWISSDLWGYRWKFWAILFRLLVKKTVWAVSNWKRKKGKGYVAVTHRFCACEAYEPTDHSDDWPGDTLHLDHCVLGYPISHSSEVSCPETHKTSDPPRQLAPRLSW